MDERSFPYLIGYEPPREGPLARYLSLIPVGEATQWLEVNLPKDYASTNNLWILDPFGTSPYLPIEIAQAGYRVLVTANNPIVRFLLQLYVKPPKKDDLTVALANLASLRRGDDRLEPYIQSLYKTRCNHCGSSVIADGFIWERGAEHEPPQILSKIYRCPSCHADGEFPVTAEDISALEQYNRMGPFQSRAIERIISYQDPVRSQVEKAVQVYLPRALYALITLINKKDSLAIRPLRMSHLDAILLSAFDLSNSMWAIPISHSRPRQLNISPKFHEINVWKALESSIDILSFGTILRAPIPFSVWPEYPATSAGISVFDGKLKDLIPALKSINIGAVITPLPRPNQAFWSLCAIWAGWLWGREAAQPIKSVLQRKRNDWGWHTKALYAVFNEINSYLDENIPIFGLTGELETGLLNAVIVASDLARLRLTGIAIRPESNQAQFNWLTTKKPNIFLTAPHKKLDAEFSPKDEIAKYKISMQERIVDYLCERGQPASYLSVHIAGLLRSIAPIGESKMKRESINSLPELIYYIYNNISEIPSQINSIIEACLTSGINLVKSMGSDKSVEVGQWWISEAISEIYDVQTPLFDRVENAIADFLFNHAVTTYYELDQSICQIFPGLLTPPPEYIQICLESYAKPLSLNNERWQLRPEDEPKTRQTELFQLMTTLITISNRLGFISEGDNPTFWRNPDGKIAYIWHILTSANFSHIVLDSVYPLEKMYLLLPGGRANLVAYKLNHDGRLNQAVQKGLSIIKFRQIRQLAQSAILYPELFKEQLSVDNVTYNAPQMRLF